MANNHPVVEEMQRLNTPFPEMLKDNIENLPEHEGSANNFLQTATMEDHPDGQHVGLAPVLEEDGVALAIQKTDGNTRISVINNKEKLAAQMQNIYDRGMHENGAACQLTPEQALQIMETVERMPNENITKGEHVDYALNVLEQKAREQAKTAEKEVEAELER